MKFATAADIAKLPAEEQADYLEVSNDALAIIETIKKGFERLRLSSIR